jgi:hypothetical protein
LKWLKQLAYQLHRASRTQASARALKTGESMKIVTKFFLSLCLVAGLGATLTTRAQIRSDATIKVNIPYSFVVNKTTLPAGTYRIKVADPYAFDTSVLEIRSADTKTALLFDTQSVAVSGPATQTALVLDKVGDTYFLRKVFLEGNERGNQLLKSKLQRRLEENGSIAESHSIPASNPIAKSSKRAVR